jgi:NodT family efflux transporter outer membrane factor (OMF) lipoprotein
MSPSGRSSSLRAVVFAFAVILDGCVHTTYQRPPLAVPASYEQSDAASAKANASSASGDARWWSRFSDPALSSLVEDALKNNGDLAVAALKIRVARLNAGLAAGNELPTVQVSASATASKPLNSSDSASPQYSVTGSVSWEVDLWGRLASLRSQAEWEAAATEQDRASAALSLTGTTATLYWKVAYYHQRVRLAEESLATIRRTLELTRAKLEAGSATALDLAQAESNVATQDATVDTLQQQLVEARRSLSLLFDGDPTAGRPESESLPDEELPSVEAGLPASLLGRRPDLRASEARLRSTLASSDSTRAAVYPTLTLTGSVGSSSDTLTRVLSNPIGTLGAGLVLPFVQWRESQRKIEISQLEYEEAVISFRRTLYQALADVQNALSARTHLRARASKLAAAVEAAARAERLSELKFREGAVALKVWLDAQETRRTAEVSLVDNRLSELENHVTLIEALGGDAVAPATN